MYEGYLYSSTVDFTASSYTDMLYIWTLLTIGYILPNIIIILSHLTIVSLYRYNNLEIWAASGNNHVRNQRLEVVLMSRGFEIIFVDCK